jgi:DNA repair protein RadA/Sms
MLLAVLEKRAGFRLGAKDVFLNITGGIRIEDPAIDLAVVAAILSSNEDITLPKDICFAAEVGLSGEIRPVPKLDQRIQEAEKLGFSKLFLAKNAKIAVQPKNIQLVPVSQIEDVVNALF